MEEASLLGGGSSLRLRRSLLSAVGSLAVLAALCALVLQGRVGHTELMSRSTSYELGRDLLAQGRRLESQGKRDLEMARRLMTAYRSKSGLRPYDGQLLGEEATEEAAGDAVSADAGSNATNASMPQGGIMPIIFKPGTVKPEGLEYEEGRHLGLFTFDGEPVETHLEMAGVRVNGWPSGAEVKDLPHTIERLDQAKQEQEKIVKDPPLGRRGQGVASRCRVRCQCSAELITVLETPRLP